MQTAYQFIGSGIFTKVSEKSLLLLLSHIHYQDFSYLPYFCLVIAICMILFHILNDCFL